MRTTLDLETSLLREAKARAAEAGESLTKLLERALRSYLFPPSSSVSDYRFRPVLGSGATLPGVDLADRDSLYEHMEGRP
jgi:hypothetical protein